MLGGAGIGERTHMTYSEVQGIAKQTIVYLEKTIVSGMTVADIVSLAEQKMKALGVTKFWYWDIGALVFAGEETVLSVSGRDYRPSNYRIAGHDIVTVDLSPMVGHVWGDYARTFIIEAGNVQTNIERICNPLFKEGLDVQQKLHQHFQRIASPHLTFEQVYHTMNRYIYELGYENLDFAGNLGHSIEDCKSKRVYFEEGNHLQLADKAYFTFEPHVRKKNATYGFKHENIYYVENGAIREL